MAPTLHKTALSSAFNASVLLLGALAGACSDSEKPATKSRSEGAQASSKPSAARGGTASGQTETGQKSEVSATLAYQQGLSWLAKGEPEKAEGEFQRAVALDPKMSEAFFELGKLQVHLVSKKAGAGVGEADSLDRGLAAFARALELEPSNDEYAFWLGRAYAQKDDNVKALQYLNKAVELNPKNGPAWKRVGLIQLQDGRTELARDSFLKSIENDPADSGARFQLGQTLELLGDPSGARTAYEKAIECDATQPEYYGKLVKLLRQLGDEESAARVDQSYQEWQAYGAKLQRRMKKVNQNPNDAVALRRLGEMYFEVGKWSEAEEWFIKSIHLDPKDALAHLYCGSARRHLKEYDAAVNHLREAEYLEPDNNLDAKLELIRLYAEMKQEKSLTDMVASVEAAAAKDGAKLYYLAEACQEVGRVEDATRLFDKAKALGVTQEPEESVAPGEEQ